MSKSAKRVLKTALMKRLRPRLAAPPYYRAAQLVLAVSGGRDSCVLLDVFWRMRHVHGSPMKVVHVDHHRGDHADEARALVSMFCQARDLPLTVADFHWDERGNFEHAASQFRRAVLAKVHGVDGYAVLAHHRQDQSETLMMALARGAGVTSPLGMQLQRDRRLRPLLDVSVDLLVDHAKAVELQWCEDPTNRDTTCFRNAIRHQVLPVLTAFHEQVDDRLSGWLGEYHALQTHLFDEARHVLNTGALAQDTHGGWYLHRNAFAETPEYLWPFLLALFWTASGIRKPKRREHLLLMDWLAKNHVGCFDHAGQRFYCDQDVLILVPKPELSPQCGRLNLAMDWGLWRLRFDWVGPDLPWIPDLREHGFQLLAGEPLPKAWRDRLRCARIPLRIRQHLPAMLIGERRLHFGELFALQAKGHLRLIRESGPDWRC